MYAIVQTGGHQYKVAPGDTIEVEKLDAEPGANVELGEVLMVIGDDGVQVGAPLVDGAKVLARVVAQGRLCSSSSLRSGTAARPATARA